MRPHRYRFSNVWPGRADAGEVLKALVDVGSYPSWWTDVREVRQVDEDSGYARCRAVLPYALNLRLRRVEEDPENGRLRGDIGGDLVGGVGAVVSGHGEWTVVRISQEVTLAKEPLSWFEPLLRPVLRANHAVMMRRGQRGLRRLLA
jgi:hypothetical protein